MHGNIIWQPKADYKRNRKVLQAHLFEKGPEQQAAATRALFTRRTIEHDAWCNQMCHKDYRQKTPFERTHIFMPVLFKLDQEWRNKWRKTHECSYVAAAKYQTWWQTRDAERIWKLRQIFDVLGLRYSEANVNCIYDYVLNVAHYAHFPQFSQLSSAKVATGIMYKLATFNQFAIDGGKSGIFNRDDLERRRKVEEIAAKSVSVNRRRSEIVTDLDALTAEMYGSPWPYTDSKRAKNREAVEASNAKTGANDKPRKKVARMQRYRPNDNSAARVRKHRANKAPLSDAERETKREADRRNQQRRRLRERYRKEAPTDIAEFISAISDLDDDPDADPVKVGVYNKIWDERADEIEAHENSNRHSDLKNAIAVEGAPWLTQDAPTADEELESLLGYLDVPAMDEKSAPLEKPKPEAEPLVYDDNYDRLNDWTSKSRPEASEQMALEDLPF
ncbi:hypothetical protein [Acuticoccus sediminis]|uniref:hypothetical protein n=1 Tax=Acuticoccus sediminis TaxID=2184697 RepID=UPI0011B94544|nr:hypothetical protein [Acuticoccus sediminis]